MRNPHFSKNEETTPLECDIGSKKPAWKSTRGHCRPQLE